MTNAIEEAREALKPFADLAESYGPNTRDSYCIENMFPGLTLGDCRRASRALAALSGEGEKECHCPEHGSWVSKADQDRLVRELDVLLNGEAGAAPQAALCDIVGQVARERLSLYRGPAPSVSGLTEEERAEGRRLLEVRNATQKAAELNPHDDSWTSLQSAAFEADCKYVRWMEVNASRLLSPAPSIDWKKVGEVKGRHEVAERAPSGSGYDWADKYAGDAHADRAFLLSLLPKQEANDGQ